MSFFWKSIAAYQEQLGKWALTDGLSTEITETCRKFCSALRSDAAHAAVNSPSNCDYISSCRQHCVDPWSNLNCLIEHELAASALKSIQTYAEFVKFGQEHWLLQGSKELLEAEHQLLEQHAVSLTGARTCMIGPGSIPYTGLALANSGAQVDLVDMYEPACAWSRQWLQRLFPQVISQVHQQRGQDMDYRSYDIVIVASMLLRRPEILSALRRDKPRHVIVRSTSANRPLCMLLNQVTADELDILQPAKLLGTTCPPNWVGNVSLLYELN